MEEEEEDDEENVEIFGIFGGTIGDVEDNEEEDAELEEPVPIVENMEAGKYAPTNKGLPEQVVAAQLPHLLFPHFQVVVVLLLVQVVVSITNCEQGSVAKSIEKMLDSLSANIALLGQSMGGGGNLEVMMPALSMILMQMMQQSQQQQQQQFHFLQQSIQMQMVSIQHQSKESPQIVEDYCKNNKQEQQEEEGCRQ